MGAIAVLDLLNLFLWVIFLGLIFVRKNHVGPITLDGTQSACRPFHASLLFTTAGIELMISQGLHVANRAGVVAFETEKHAGTIVMEVRTVNCGSC